MKYGINSVSPAGGTMRVSERTLALRLEQLADEIRGIRGELALLDKRVSEGNASRRAQIGSLRNEMQAELRAVDARIESVGGPAKIRIDALSQRLDNALGICEKLVTVQAMLAARIE